MIFINEKINKMKTSSNVKKDDSVKEKKHLTLNFFVKINKHLDDTN